MIIGIVFSIIVAILWSLGEVNYSNISKQYDRHNIYMYSYLFRAIIYISVVLIFDFSLIGTFNTNVFINVLPIILCDLVASLLINIAVANGKLSVVSPIMAAYPVLDIILGALLLTEDVSSVNLFLVGLICISIIVLAFSQKKSKRAPHPIKGIIFAIMYMLLVAFSTYFEKSIYISNFSVYDLYYYKGIVYTFASLLFAIIVVVTPTKMKNIDVSILKGCGLTPIGNVLYSFALQASTITIVAPLSSLYSVITNIISRIILKEKITIEERVCIGLIIVCTLLLIILGFIT